LAALIPFGYGEAIKKKKLKQGVAFEMIKEVGDSKGSADRRRRDSTPGSMTSQACSLKEWLGSAQHAGLEGKKLEVALNIVDDELIGL
jgi:hypothetical protein